MIEILSRLLDIAIVVFAVTSMLSVGFGWTVRQIIAPFRDVRRVVIALVANFVLVPLLAIAVVHLLQLDRGPGTGLILLASAAGAPFLIMLTKIAEGDVALSATLLVLLLPVTVAYMPIVVPLAAPEAAVNPATIATPLFSTMLLPMGIGLFIRARGPRRAERLQPIVSKVAIVALVVVLVTTVWVNVRAFLGVLGNGTAILAALLVVGGAFVIGYLLGGPDPRTRSVRALGAGQRNIAAATVVATESFDDPDVLVMVAVSSIVSMLLLFPGAWALRRRARRTEADAATRKERRPAA